MKLVNKYTRAGNNGKEIICPLCDNKHTVFHFSWSALTCQCCRDSIDKPEWILV